MKDILTERSGHITYFIWHVGPYLPEREKLADTTLRLSMKHQIAGADYKNFPNGILSVSFNPFATNEKARKDVENIIVSIIAESRFDD